MKVIDPMVVRWGLTGSFTSNGLEDVFGQCKIVDQSLLGPIQRRVHAAVFCADQQGVWRVGATCWRVGSGHATHQAGHLRVGSQASTQDKLPPAAC